MLLLAHWLIIFVLGFYVLQLARKDGLLLPGCIATLWLVGYFGFPLLGIEGGLYFITYGALLCLVLIYMDMTRDKMGYRATRADSLSEMQVDSERGED